MLSVRQVNEWMDFYGREPWGFDADDTRTALVALTVARSAGSKRAKLNDFRLRPHIDDATARGRSRGKADPEELKNRLRVLFGGRARN